MNYTYEIIKFRPAQEYLQVKYSTDGLPDIFKNFRLFLSGQSPATVEAYVIAHIESNVPVDEWQRLADAAAISEGDVTITGPQSGVYTPPVDPPPPDPPTLEEQIAQRVDEVVAEATQHSISGVYWTAPNSDVFFIPTTPEYITRMKEVKREIQFEGRSDGGIWRVGKLDGQGELFVTHVRLNTTQFQTMVTQVITHVNKSIEAEANTCDAVLAGNLTADYMTEYAAL